ncbi:MAG: ATPase, partial [Prevotella sp.]|nr:ATPase [Prevotella sp.]
KRFLNAIFKGELPASMRDDYLHQTGQTLADIIRKVYSEPMPNRFLASTSLYIGSHLDEPLLRQLIVDNFRLFFRRNLLPYQRKDLPVGVVGSIGWHYQEQLREAAEAEGFTLGTIIKSPMEGLIRFHS